MADLHIPDAALDNAVHGLEGFPIADSDMQDAATYVLQAGGPRLIAHELRALADELDTGYQPARIGRAVEASSAQRREGVDLAVARLRRRADELDPPQSGGDH